MRLVDNFQFFSMIEFAIWFLVGLDRLHLYLDQQIVLKYLKEI